MPRGRRKLQDEAPEADSNGSATAVADAPGETPIMFPDLDDTKPEHKALIKAARALAKAKAERDALLTTSKEKVDGLADKLKGLMHENGMTKFKHAGVMAEVIAREEKVVVQLDEEDSGEE